jgi:hypothetical protein
MYKQIIGGKDCEVPNGTHSHNSQRRAERDNTQQGKKTSKRIDGGCVSTTRDNVVCLYLCLFN